MDLNQGFHTLLQNGRSLSWKELLVPEKGLLPIRHYKLAKVFSRAHTGDRPFERAEQYFERTRKNLERIAGADPNYIHRSWRATPFKRQYAGAHEFPFYYNLHQIQANAENIN